MSGHTPGPWTLKHFAGVSSIHGPLRGRTVVRADTQFAEVRTFHANATPAERDEIDANAELIVAAPELLDALEWVLSSESDCDRCRTARGRCVGHTAIAKARGE